ncbi:alpha/beta-hydrolase [Obba rivulosa]|uniref:Alpha/beta-hydrolase n=1 Tax=Obba rivulosa TaxID=1052685 RepID=A0A8E2AQB9_9APHY|nr:alpha/beta-hydrolase [Obba rivulosa]
MKPFAFRRQPFKAIYLTFSILHLLMRLPVWTVVGLVPAFRPRRSWTLRKTLIVKTYRALLGMMFNTSILSPDSPENYVSTAHETGFVWVDAAPDLITGEIRDFAAVNDVSSERTCGFWYGARGIDGSAGQRASKDERLIYHMHGGGYIMGTANPSSMAVAALFKGFFEHFGPNIRIFALEYRKSTAPPFGSANPFPAALLDAIAGYRYLVEDVGFHPQNIIISGDSAGGGLAFDLALYLATYKFPNLLNAGGLLLLSPSIDPARTHVGPGSTRVLNSPSDYVQPFTANSYARDAFIGNIPDEDVATNMWICPGSMRLTKLPGVFAGFPRTCIVTGDAEMMLDSMRTLRDRLQDDIGRDRVFYVEIADATHDFCTMAWHEPERTRGLRQVGEWVRTVWESDKGL